MNNKIITIIIVLFFVAGGYLFWSAFNTKDDDGGTTSNRGNTINEPSAIPAYPGSTLNDSYTKNGLSHAEYETKAGISAAQLLDYYESELSTVGWKTNMRDENDAKLEMLSDDGEQLRIAIFFTGYGDQGVVYFVDNRLPGGDAWPPMPMQ